MSAASGCYLNFYYGSVFIVIKLWYSKSSQSKGMISRIRSNFSFFVVIFLRKRFELTEVNEGVKQKTDDLYPNLAEAHPIPSSLFRFHYCMQHG
jgi:hypothetical protein